MKDALRSGLMTVFSARISMCATPQLCMACNWSNTERKNSMLGASSLKCWRRVIPSTTEKPMASSNKEHTYEPGNHASLHRPQGLGDSDKLLCKPKKPIPENVSTDPSHPCNQPERISEIPYRQRVAYVGSEQTLVLKNSAVATRWFKSYWRQHLRFVLRLRYSEKEPDGAREPISKRLFEDDCQ